MSTDQDNKTSLSDWVCAVFHGGPWDGKALVERIDEWPPSTNEGYYRRTRYSSMPTWEVDAHCVVRAAEYEWVEASHD